MVEPAVRRANYYGWSHGLKGNPYVLMLWRFSTPFINHSYTGSLHSVMWWRWIILRSLDIKILLLILKLRFRCFNPYMNELTARPKPTAPLSSFGIFHSYYLKLCYLRSYLPILSSLFFRLKFVIYKVYKIAIIFFHKFQRTLILSI